MSACISRHGEFSDHEPDKAGYCNLCGDLDLAAHDAEVRAAALTDAADNFLWAGEDEDYAAFMGWLRDRATWERQGRKP